MRTMLFNPYTGLPRHPSDIASDPAGMLMVAPDEPLFAVPAPHVGDVGGEVAAQAAAVLDGKSLNAKAADLLRPFLKPGEKVIWRDSFRWKDDDGVLSNHYDSMELESLAADFGYDIDWDTNFKHAAIVRSGAVATGAAQPATQGETDGTA